MIRISCSAIIFIILLSLATSVHAHLFGHRGGSEVEYGCKPHHHGRFLHRCSDEQHRGIDVTHSHPGLQTYHARRPDFYVGVKTGAFSVRSQDLDSEGIPAGILAGYGTANLSVELELSRGDVSSAEPTAFNRNARTQGRYDTVAIYGTHRFGGNVFGKVKAGLRKNWATTGTTRITNEDFSLGLGIGKTLGRFTAELEWTRLETDVLFTSLGLNYKF